MKRKLALFLCALMALLPVAALAETAPEVQPVNLYLRLSNPVIYAGEDLRADLTGLSAELGVNSDGSACSGLYATLNAGKASLSAALAADAREVRFYMDDLTHLYTATMDEGETSVMEAMGMNTEALEALASLANLDVEAYGERITAALEELQPQLIEALDNDATQTGVKWRMYDEKEHDATRYTVTLPTQLLRQYVEVFYQTGLELMTEVATALQAAGMDVSLTETGSLDEAFAHNPTLTLDGYQAEDDPNLMSLVFILADDTGAEYPPVCANMHFPGNGIAVNVQAGDLAGDAVELGFASYDDGRMSLKCTAIEDGAPAGSFSFLACPDETGGFVIHHLSLETEDASLFATHQFGNGTSRHVQASLNAEGENVALVMTTVPAADGLSEAGRLSLTVEGVTVLACDVEWGVGGSAPAFDQAANLPRVDMSAMTEDQITVLSLEVQSALMTFLADAVTEVPALADMINSLTAPATAPDSANP